MGSNVQWGIPHKYLRKNNNIGLRKAVGRERRLQPYAPSCSQPVIKGNRYTSQVLEMFLFLFYGANSSIGPTLSFLEFKTINYLLHYCYLDINDRHIETDVKWKSFSLLLLSGDLELASLQN